MACEQGQAPPPGRQSASTRAAIPCPTRVSPEQPCPRFSAGGDSVTPEGSHSFGVLKEIKTGTKEILLVDTGVWLRRENYGLEKTLVGRTFFPSSKWSGRGARPSLPSSPEAALGRPAGRPGALGRAAATQISPSSVAKRLDTPL